MIQEFMWPSNSLRTVYSSTGSIQRQQQARQGQMLESVHYLVPGGLQCCLL
jgi:hypothetical protein